MQKKIGLVLLSVVAVVAGCGKGSGGGNTPTLTASDVRLKLAVANCQNRAKCGQIGASEEAKCEADAAASIMNYPETYSQVDAVNAKRLTFDAAAAEKCIAAFQALGCTVDQQIAAFDACDPVFKAAVAVGGACQADGECVTGYCDYGDGGTDGCAGSCKALLKTGDTCDTSNSHCATTDYCDGTTKKCTARAAQGEACGSAPRCRLDLFCQGYEPASSGQPEVKGKCEAPGKVGETCVAYFFGNTSCEPGLYCDATTSQCAARIAAGAECGSYDACQDGLDCIGYDVDPDTGETTATGTCGKWLDIGEMCADPAVYETGCPWNSLCDSMTKKCTVYGGAGDDCSDAGTQGYCGTTDYYCAPDGKCSPMVALGATCTPPPTDNDTDPCQAGTCDPMTNKCTLVCQ